MLVVVPPDHTNILLASATQCCLFGSDFQPWVMKKNAKNREHCHVFATVAKRGETNEKVTIFIMEKTLEQIFVDKKCIYCVDGAPSPHCIGSNGNHPKPTRN